VKIRGRAATGLALGAAGMLYSRLTGRRAEQQEHDRPQAPQAREPNTPPPEVPPAEVERAKTELADELARRAGDTFRT
jgi:hypothetical protein